MAEVTAMRNNVLAYPVYGLPYVVTFPILDADGDLVTGAAGLDSEVSKNGDTFADCTNEATEIATSSGIYYLSLTATEMTADIVTVIVKTSTSGAKTTTLTLYPVKLPSLLTGTAAAGAAGTITLANVADSLAVDDYFNGCLIYTTGGTGSGQARRISDYVGSTRVASVKPQWATTPDNTTTYEIYLTDTAVNALKANVSALSGDATAADNLEAYCDGTTPQPVNTTQIAGAAVSTSTAQIGVNVVNAAGTAWGSGAITAGAIASSAITSAKFASGAITATVIAADAIGASELAADAVTEIVTGVWNAATGSYGGAGTYGQAVEDALADTNELQTDLVNGGRLDLLIDAIKAKTDNLPASPAATGSAMTLADDAITAAKFDESTAFPLKSSDTGATAIARAGADSDTLETLSDQIDGISITAGAVADAVWDEAIGDHAGVGSTGAALAAAGSAGDPWSTVIPGSYGAGTAGKILGDNINAPIATVDTVVDAIKAKTDSLTFTVAGDVDCNVQTWKGSTAPAMTGDAYAVLADAETGLVPTSYAVALNGIAIGKIPKSDGSVTWNNTALASIQGECTDALNAYDPPTKAEMDAAFATTDGYVDTELAAISSTLTTMDGKVDDILLDTGTTIPATLTTLGSTVWNTLLTALTTTGSIGKALADWLVARVPGSTAFTASDVAVCNNALLLLGNNAITALTDDTKAAKLCLQFYQQTVDAVLRAYTWNCATVRSADLTATTAPTFGFSYAYTLPADCLRVLMIEDDETIKFKIEGSTILTDESTCKISYIKRITPDDADGLLIETISARLAATIAFSLTNSVSATEAMWKLYKDKLDEAQTIDAFEGTAPQMASDDWINSRS